MNILFVHQNFPGQYRELFAWLVAQGGHEIVFLTQRAVTQPVAARGSSLPQPPQGRRRRLCPVKILGGLLRQRATARRWPARNAARRRVHPRYHPRPCRLGRADLLKDRSGPTCRSSDISNTIFLARGGSVGFDPEFPASDHAPFIMHARNAVNFANIQTVDLGQSPTAVAARHLSRKLSLQASTSAMTASAPTSCAPMPRHRSCSGG
jgi:hypothetical protein